MTPSCCYIACSVGKFCAHWKRLPGPKLTPALLFLCRHSHLISWINLKFKSLIHIRYTELTEHSPHSLPPCPMKKKFFLIKVWPNDGHLCFPRPLANCRCVRVWVQGVWLGSCLGQCGVNYKAEAVWWCRLSSPPLLLACRPAGSADSCEVVGEWSCCRWRRGGWEEEIDHLCRGADNIVLDFAVPAKFTGWFFVKISEEEKEWRQVLALIKNSKKESVIVEIKYHVRL